MAGNYPDPPGARLAYDRDGTLGYMTYRSWANDLPAQFTEINTVIPQAHLRNMNDESPTTKANPDGVNSGYADHYLVFPTLRDLVGIYITGYSSAFQWSANTTNGVDGTWTAVPGVVNRSAGTKMSQRSEITALALTGVKAIRFVSASGGSSSYAGVTNLHLYGHPTSAGDRLEFWHPTLDQPLRNTPAHLDWGDRVRGTTEVRSVRVKNLSSTMTASGIVVAMESLTPASPTLESQTQLRVDGGTYGNTASLVPLGPGQVSAVIDIQQNLDAAAALSLWSQRLYTTVATWS